VFAEHCLSGQGAWIGFNRYRDVLGSGGPEAGPSEHLVFANASEPFRQVLLKMYTIDSVWHVPPRDSNEEPDVQAFFICDGTTVLARPGRSNAGWVSVGLLDSFGTGKPTWDWLPFGSTKTTAASFWVPFGDLYDDKEPP
jgi:hypothetical protein